MALKKKRQWNRKPIWSSFQPRTWRSSKVSFCVQHGTQRTVSQCAFSTHTSKPRFHTISNNALAKKWLESIHMKMNYNLACSLLQLLLSVRSFRFWSKLMKVTAWSFPKQSDKSGPRGRRQSSICVTLKSSFETCWNKLTIKKVKSLIFESTMSLCTTLAGRGFITLFQTSLVTRLT